MAKKKSKLPEHLAKLLDTPAKRKRARKIMAQGRADHIKKYAKKYAGKKITIAQVGYNYYDVRIGGVPVMRSMGKINAERQANILRKTVGRRTRA